MKKTKKLIAPVVALTTVGSVLPVIALTTSCGKKLHEEHHIIEPTKEERTATTTPGIRHATYTLTLDTDTAGDRYHVELIPTSNNEDIQLKAEVESTSGKTITINVSVVGELVDTGNLTFTFALKITSEIYSWYQQINDFTFNYIASGLNSIFLTSNKLSVEWGVPNAGDLKVKSHIPEEAKIIKTDYEINGNGLSYDLETGKVTVSEKNGGGTIVIKCTDSNGVTRNSRCTVTSTNNVGSISIYGSHNVDIDEAETNPYHFWVYDDYGRDQSYDATWEIIEGGDLAEIVKEGTGHGKLILKELAKENGGSVTIQAKYYTGLYYIYATHTIELGSYNKLDTEKLSVGKVDCYDTSIEGKVIIPNVYYNANNDPVPVTTMDTGAFNNCNDLTEVSFPANFKTINQKTFVGCQKFEHISVVSNSPYFMAANDCLITRDKNPLGKWAGANCIVLGTKSSQLDNSLPNSVTEIGAHVFEDLNLTYNDDIKLPSSMTKIHESAFSKSNIKKLSFYNTDPFVRGKLTIEKAAFQYCYELTEADLTKSGCTSLGAKDIFADCTSLASVSIPNTCKQIGSSALYGCPITEFGVEDAALHFWNYNNKNVWDVPLWQPIDDKTVNAQYIKKFIQDSSLHLYRCETYFAVEDQGNNEIFIGLPVNVFKSPFTNLHILNNHTIGNTTYKITGISTGGFALNTNITDITTEPDSLLKTIGDESFNNSQVLKTVDFSRTQVDTIGSSAFRQSNQLTTVNLNNGKLKTIKGYAFKDCPLLETFNITGDPIESIGEALFDGCVKLKSVDLGVSTITEILPNTFKGCSSLETLNLQNQAITNIGDFAFEDCKSLTSWGSDSSKITHIGRGAFQNCSSLKQFSFAGANTKIEQYAFSGSGIWEVDLSQTTLTDETIPDDCFSNNDKLVDVNINNSSIKTIGQNAFLNCPNIEVIRIGPSVTSLCGSYLIDAYCFYIDPAHQKAVPTFRTVYVDSSYVVHLTTEKRPEDFGFLFSVGPEGGTRTIYTKNYITVEDGYIKDHFKQVASEEPDYNKWVAK